MTGPSGVDAQGRKLAPPAGSALRARRPGDPVPDGEGTIFERAAAWTAVEQAKELLNLACREVAELDLTIRNAITGFEEAVEEYHRLGAGHWWVVRDAQRNINGLAEQYADLEEPLRLLRAALAEYVRIGGAADRAPGVGGLS